MRQRRVGRVKTSAQAAPWNRGPPWCVPDRRRMLPKMIKCRRIKLVLLPKLIISLSLLALYFSLYSLYFDPTVTSHYTLIPPLSAMFSPKVCPPCRCSLVRGSTMSLYCPAIQCALSSNCFSTEGVHQSFSFPWRS